MDRAELVQAFSAPHGAMLSAWALLTISLCIAGRSARARGFADRLDRVLGIAALVAWLIVGALWPAPGRRSLADSLPIYLCDLAFLAAGLAMLIDHRLPRALLYFWGVALCSQGLLVPVDRPGPSHPEFWLTWITHSFIGAYATYDLIARRYRPIWRDWRSATLLGLGYAIAVFTLDTITGWNYGYLGPSPAGTSPLLGLLGDWPLRAVWVVLLGFIGVTSIMLPWEIAGRVRPEGAAQA
ncbi:MAG TPA: TIGR02206 family membrane protein [Phycisphaerales bacterium]|nr:TIGR02206 family membrane protein [Phycisphaerales bacterium]